MDTKVFKAYVVMSHEKGEATEHGSLRPIISVIAVNEWEAAVQVRAELSKPGRAGYLQAWESTGCLLLREGEQV